MKLKNAPERKRQRRLAALEKLEEKYEELKPYPHSLALLSFKTYKKGEMETLQERTHFNLRNIQTKKRR